MKENQLHKKKFATLILWLLTINLTYAEDSEFKSVSPQWTDNPPKIDGQLDETSWQSATIINDFVQHEPTAGAPTELKTNVYLLYDKNRLYVGFECHKSDMDKLMTNETRRDSRFFLDDYVAVYLDTYLDRRNCYGFELNALGTQADRRVQNEGANSGRRGSDMAWGCNWDGRAAQREDKWTAEFSIPFAELRFAKKADSIWGINFWRQDRSNREEISWSDLNGREYAVSRFGHLVDLDVESLNTRRPLKVKPYGTIMPQKIGDQKFKTEPAGGIDFRYPLSNLTFDFTLNPDFAQIEADPDMVNLTDIPLRFAEKRPFFQEGNEIFQTPIELFYSRRVEDLQQGGKMAGKIGDYNTALVLAQAGPEDMNREVGMRELPLGNYAYSVFRLQREFGRSATVGLLGANKQNGSDYDRTSGIDARFVLPENLEVNLEYANEWKTGLDRSQAVFAELSREANFFSFKAKYFDVGQDFNPEMGFVPRIDRRGINLRTSLEKRWKGRIQFLRSAPEYERLYDHQGTLTNHRFKFENIIGISNMYFFLSPEWYYHLEDDGEKFTDRTLDFFYGWFPPKWISVRTRNSFGIRKGQESFFVGPEITIRPTDKFSLEVKQQRLIEDSELVELTTRIALNYQFDQRIYARASLEQTIEKDRRFFVLFAYEYRPESNFFIVYNNNQTKKGENEQILFVKLVYLQKLFG
ncbi:TPA: hypothetical protein EYM26_06805 [Candidatus Poribacteria bacterium]|nr:hypothetical protein [Candidatus Poribacteria bacterium]